MVKKVKVKSLSCVRLFVTPWTVAYQAPQYMEFSRQEYWSGLPFPSPGDLPNPRIKPGSPALQTDALPSVPPGKPFFTVVKNPPVSARDIRDASSTPGLRRPPGGHSNSLQYSSLENPIDRGAWWATVQGVPKSQTRLSTHTEVPRETDVNRHI